jgi:uncharacterized membrane protein YphA (DoxX/SURF4 family)
MSIDYLFPADSRNRSIAYWVVTVLVAAEAAVGGLWNVLRIPYVRTDMMHLGYPLYVLTITGIWNLLGAVVVLAPRLPRLKEWAYAGLFFEYTGAVISHLAVGDGQAVAFPLVVSVLVLVSWALRPSARRNEGINHAVAGGLGKQGIGRCRLGPPP